MSRGLRKERTILRLDGFDPGWNERVRELPFVDYPGWTIKVRVDASMQVDRIAKKIIWAENEVA